MLQHNNRITVLRLLIMVERCDKRCGDIFRATA